MKQPAFNELHANNLLGIKDQSIYHLASAMLATARATEGLPKGNFDFEHLKLIHHHLLQDIHDWAGTTRTTESSRRISANPKRIEELASKAISNLSAAPASKMTNDEFAVSISFCYARLVAISPFNDGNNRAIRSFLKEYAQSVGRNIKWEELNADDFNFAVERAIGRNGDISLLSEQLKKSVSHLDLFEEYNAETVHNKTLEIAAFAGIPPAAFESSARLAPPLQSLAEDVTQRLIKDLRDHAKGLPSKLDWDKSSIAYEIKPSLNADMLDSGIANVLSVTDLSTPEPASDNKKDYSHRLG